MTEMADYSDSQIVGVYRQLRAKRDEAKEKFAAEQRPVLDLMEQFENEAKKRLQDRDQNSFSTDSGTCYTKTVHKFTAPNKSAFLDWVKRTGEWELLDVRPAGKEVQAYLEEHKELPEGLNSSSHVNTNFNAPRKK